MNTAEYAAIMNAVRGLSDRLRVLEAVGVPAVPSDAEMFDHFAGDGTIDPRWTTAVSGSATVSLPNATPSYARLASGATGSSVAVLDWGARRPLVGMAAGVDMRCRARFPTAVDANTGGGPGFRGPTALTQLNVGVTGSVSTGFFVARSIDPGVPTLTNTITTVAIDTTWHEFRVQTFPDRVRYFIDNELVAEHVNGGAVVLPLSQPLMPLFAASNGATAADRQFDIDWAWVRENR